MAYSTRYGLRATVRRSLLAVKRAGCSNRMVLFYCELRKQITGPADIPDLKVERKRTDSELSPTDLREILNAWNPRQAYRNMLERFSQGASLWLIRSQNRLVGYGWSLQGTTIEPHYFPLGSQDVHLFDFYVFPQHRGRGLNPFLTMYILRSLASDGGGRAFIEAAEWNQAQLSSLEKTPFRCLGCATKWTIFQRTIVWWSRHESGEKIDTEPSAPVRRRTGKPADAVQLPMSGGRRQ